MKLRRTMMYVTGNNAANIKDAQIYGADSIMFDLEDSVAISEKDSARFLVQNAIKNNDYDNIELVVRINGLETPYGHADLEAMVNAGVDVIRLPKTETAQDVIDIENLVKEYEKKYNKPEGSIKLMAAVESAIGIININEIAFSSKRLIGIAIGGEDFVTDMKTNRSPEGIELLTARSLLVLACRAAGIYALDTVYSDINNEEGFREETEHIKQLGFDGKSVIHPSQIEIVHDVYAPTIKEVEHSVKVIIATEDAKKKGIGVVVVNGKMVDGPIIERAKRVIELAKSINLKVGGINLHEL